jgi:hypothetical protein
MALGRYGSGMVGHSAASVAERRKMKDVLVEE